MADNPAPGSIDKIIGKIQEELARRKGTAASHAPPAAEESSPRLEAFHQALSRAEQLWQVGANLPPMTETTGVKRMLAVPAASAFLRLSQLITRDQREFNQSVIGALQVLATTLSDRRSGDLSKDVSALAASLREVAAQGDADDQTQSERTRALEKKVAELAALVASQQETIAALKGPGGPSRLDTLEGKVKELAAQTTGPEGLRHGLQAIREELGSAARAQSGKLAQLATSQILLERRLAIVLDQAQKALPKTMDREQLQVLADEKSRVDDAVYLEFEARFRGRWDDIKARVSEHLPTIKAAGAGSAERPVLDLGSGRGEWLSALKDAGLVARGVDTNRSFVEDAQRAGLKVIEADCLAYLRELPDKSCGAVTGLHLLEHLPFPVLTAVLAETVRVLVPGGVAIFETPNPENLLVGACQFYLDPSHLRPLHPETLRFLAEANGLADVAVQRLHPVGPEHHFPGDGTVLTQRLNHLFHGPQDYAIIGHRA